MRIVNTLALIGMTMIARNVAGQRPDWLTLAPRPAYLDSVPDAMRASIATSVAAAEAEGRAWPLRPEPCTQVSTECAGYFDYAMARKCADTRAAPSARSGEIVVGGSLFSPVGPQRLWWVPMHPANGDRLVVRAVHLANPADTVRFTLTEWSRGLPDGEFYYLTRFDWPKGGRWLVVATIGSDWGCFIL